MSRQDKDQGPPTPPVDIENLNDLPQAASAQIVLSIDSLDDFYAKHAIGFGCFEN